MEKKHQVSHCGLKNGETLTLKPGEKIGFVCEGCRELFDVDYDGNVVRSPLNDVEGAQVCRKSGGNVCTGFGGRLGNEPRFRGKKVV